MTRLVGLVWIACAATACYSGGAPPCNVSCDDGRCPSGLTCNGQQRCVANASDTCDLVPDAAGPIDQAVHDSVDALCTWSVSNVEPCTHGADVVAVDWTIGATTIIDSSNLSILPLPPAGIVKKQIGQSPGASDVMLIAVRDLTVNAAVTVRGPLPVIILANGGVMITNTITVEPTASVDPACNAGVGGNGANTPTAGGGGGGGFGRGNVIPSTVGGGTGGAGFQNAGAAGTAGAQNGNTSLVPLRVGCPGGAGGTHSLAPSAGGKGGGALQISTLGNLVLTTATGVITAPGEHGQNGGSKNGGGGGGSGGALLLEAPAVSLGTGAKLCANGGGGGGGQGAGGGETIAGDGICSTGAGAAGGGSPAGAPGGNGNNRFADPTGGTASPASDRGGGGGGGGAGRIHINGTLIEDSGSLVLPRPQ